MLTFDELWQRLNEYDEVAEIEAKHGSRMGDSALETISAFSNEPRLGGGYILFGLRSRDKGTGERYEVVGVPDAEQLQRDLAVRSNTEFNQPVRPVTWPETRDGRTVVVAYVPEAQPHEKPVYLAKRGPLKGAFRRISAADMRCSDSDIERFYAERSHQAFDQMTVQNASLDDIDPLAMQDYRRLRAQVDAGASELQFSDEDLLYALNCASRRDPTPTIAGLLLFGTRASIRRCFPLARVDYIRMEGKEWVPDPERRGQHMEIQDPLLRAIPRITSQVMDDIPRAFHLPMNELLRQEIPLVPRRALEELTVNAVMHRDYRIGSPIQIIRYSNRLEFRNPGVSLVPEEMLGQPGSRTRNNTLASVLHDTPFAEAKGTGIRAVREIMRKHGLDPPVFESDPRSDTFTVTILFHHLLGPDDLEWLSQFHDLDLSPEEQKALVIVREVGAIHNAAYRDINSVETLSASAHLRRLRDLGLLEQRGSGTKTFYVPTIRFQETVARAGRTVVLPATAPGESGITSRESSSESGESGMELSESSTEPSESGLPHDRSGSPHDRSTSRHDRSVPRHGHDRLAAADLPPDLVDAIKAINNRTPDEIVRDLIIRVCAASPMTADALGALFGRRPTYLRQRHLRPLVLTRQLAYLHPESPRRRGQAYIAARPEGEDTQ